MTSCSGCGASLPAGVRYCNVCGKPTPSSPSASGSGAPSPGPPSELPTTGTWSPAPVSGPSATWGPSDPGAPMGWGGGTPPPGSVGVDRFPHIRGGKPGLGPIVAVFPALWVMVGLVQRQFTDPLSGSGEVSRWLWGSRLENWGDWTVGVSDAEAAPTIFLAMSRVLWVVLVLMAFLILVRVARERAHLSVRGLCILAVLSLVGSVAATWGISETFGGADIGSGSIDSFLDYLTELPGVMIAVAAFITAAILPQGH